MCKHGASNKKDWQDGFNAGKAGLICSHPPYLHALSWISGYIEGKAEYLKGTDNS